MQPASGGHDKAAKGSVKRAASEGAERAATASEEVRSVRDISIRTKHNKQPRTTPQLDALLSDQRDKVIKFILTFRAIVIAYFQSSCLIHFLLELGGKGPKTRLTREGTAWSRKEKLPLAPWAWCCVARVFRIKIRSQCEPSNHEMHCCSPSQSLSCIRIQLAQFEYNGVQFEYNWFN